MASLNERLLWGVLLAVVLVLTSLWGWRFLVGDQAELPILTEVPDFHLQDRDGSWIHRDDLAGGPWVADFIFTRCVAICPRMTQQMKLVQEGLPAGAAASLVSFSVDPEHDTPEVLAEYARSHGIDEGAWHFLTGPAEEIHSLSRDGFWLALDTSPPPEVAGPDPITHSNRLVLVDSEARVRGYYDPFETGAIERLLADLRSLL